MVKINIIIIFIITKLLHIYKIILIINPLYYIYNNYNRKKKDDLLKNITMFTYILYILSNV